MEQLGQAAGFCGVGRLHDSLRACSACSAPRLALPFLLIPTLTLPATPLINSFSRQIADIAIEENSDAHASLDVNGPQFKICADMMGLDAEMLKQSLLQKRSIIAKETTWKPRSRRAAEGARDSLCRHVSLLLEACVSQSSIPAHVLQPA